MQRAISRWKSGESRPSVDSLMVIHLKRVQQTKDPWVLVLDNSDYDSIAIEKNNIPNSIIGRVIWSWTSWVREPLFEPVGSTAKKNGLV